MTRYRLRYGLDFRREAATLAIAVECCNILIALDLHRGATPAPAMIDERTATGWVEKWVWFGGGV